MTLLHGRHVGPLITMWVTILALAAGVYWLQNTMPALIDILAPVYIALAIGLIVGTIKWFRERARHHERRRADRRHSKRRDGHSLDSSS